MSTNNEKDREVEVSGFACPLTNEITKELSSKAKTSIKQIQQTNENETVALFVGSLL